MTIGVPTTQAQAAVMQGTADRFDQVNQSLQTMLKTLLGELEGLRGQWDGAGGRSFEQVTTAWSDDQSELHRLLAETAGAIRTSGRNYSATDMSAADRFGGRRGGGRQLPL